MTPEQAKLLLDACKKDIPLASVNLPLLDAYLALHELATSQPRPSTVKSKQSAFKRTLFDQYMLTTFVIAMVSWVIFLCSLVVPALRWGLVGAVFGSVLMAIGVLVAIASDVWKGCW